MMHPKCFDVVPKLRITPMTIITTISILAWGYVAYHLI